jgi:tRNA threonylcarbamoyladenosine biosynthesis protein TsaB
VRIGIGIAQGLALGAGLPMIGVSTLATMAQGAWRKTGATRVLAAIDARMGEVYWAEYTRDEQGVWHGEASEAVLKPEAVSERLKQLSGTWAMVGTGWKAWPDMALDSGLILEEGDMLLPEAELTLQHTVHTANFLLFTQLHTIVRQTRFTRTVLARSLFNFTLGIDRANARLKE